MAKTVKMADIAKKVGVSVVTVSKALTGQKGVSESTRQQILKLALSSDTMLKIKQSWMSL